VYEANFSDLSSHDSWKFPMTREDELVILRFLQKYYGPPVWVGDVSKAEGICRKRMRGRIVEYGFTNLISDVSLHAENTVFRHKQKQTTG
jgi:hypothetical protein